MIELSNLVMSSAAAGGIVALFSALMAAFYGAFILLYCVMIIFSLVVFVFWIWMLIDALSRKNYDTENDRFLWCLIVFLGSWIGALIYYFLVKKKKDPPKVTPSSPSPTKQEVTSPTKSEVKPTTAVKPTTKPEAKN